MTKPIPGASRQSQPIAKPSTRRNAFLQQTFAATFGAFLCLVLLKFGNPPVMERWVTPPSNIWEFVLNCPWPIRWGYGLLALTILTALPVWQWKQTNPPWLLWLPAAWLGWQFLSATQTIDARLTEPTLWHFTSCVACFYLGFFALSSVERLNFFWPGILIAFALILLVGFEQHFGGLEETRRYWLTYIYPTMPDAPPELLKKISSTRIFSTLFYPNTLAGALLLLLPISLGLLWQVRHRFTVPARSFLAGVILLGSTACLFWSGSKGGWLLMLLLGLLALLRLDFKKSWKFALIGLVLGLGLAGFAFRYATFFKKGATSVVARFDYWQAAIHTAGQHPLLGTGPGTFQRAYEAVKKPESEPARLAHNDYLQQASDSGIPGGLLYLAFIGMALFITRPSHFLSANDDWFEFSIWAGILGFSLQSCVEFGLYIPALTWPAFSLLGFLVQKRTGTV